MKTGDNKVSYSICVTTYNAAKTISSSLGSLLNHIDDRFELVVVDNASTDGSLDFLRRLAGQGKIELVVARCSRGKGRQIAFEHSRGAVIISNVDMDDIFEPTLQLLVSAYKSSLSGRVLRVVNKQKRGAVTLSPRPFLDEVGGWPDLNYVEDRYIWGRAAEQGIYCWSEYPLYSKVTKSREKRSFLQRVDRIYGIQRDRIRIGAKPHVYKSTWPLYPISYLAAKKAKQIARPIFGGFWPDDPKYHADFVQLAPPEHGVESKVREPY